MFDSLYPEASDTALSTKAREIAPPPPVPWFRGAWSAIGQAVPRAGAEIGRAGTALLTPEAVGALDAPSMFSAPGKAPKEQQAEEIRQQDAALRDAIKEFTPDPQATGAASMILHDVTRFVGKAGAYSLLGGTPAAVAGMTLDEGTNEALKRMDEGVDPVTAAKLGIVHGVSSGVQVALPVAGKTVTQTVGLALAGGPASYVAEQATARKILQDADYSKEAAQIDPFDPLGLGVSFLGPLLFGAGAHVARGARLKAEAKLADERMLAADRPPGEQTPVARAAQEMGAPRQEHVDAAHVAELQAFREGQALHAREDVAGADAHLRALDRASEQLAAGRRVEVTDLARLTPPDTPAARAALDEIDALHAQRAQLLPVVGELADRGEIARIREELRQAQEALPATGPEAERALAKELQAQGGVSYKQALSEAKKELAGRVADAEARIERLQHAIESNATAQQASQKLAEIDRRLADLEEAAPVARLSRFQRAMSDAVMELQRGRAADARRAPAPEPKVEPASAPAPAAKPAEPARPAPAAGPVADAAAHAQRVIEQAMGRQPEAAAAPAAKAEPGADFHAAEADRIVAEAPDMMVMLEGMDKPMRASDLLAEAKAMEAQERADAPLLRVAAECALRG